MTTSKEIQELARNAAVAAALAGVKLAGEDAAAAAPVDYDKLAQEYIAGQQWDRRSEETGKAFTLAHRIDNFFNELPAVVEGDNVFIQNKGLEPLYAKTIAGVTKGEFLRSAVEVAAQRVQWEVYPDAKATAEAMKVLGITSLEDLKGVPTQESLDDLFHYHAAKTLDKTDYVMTLPPAPSGINTLKEGDLVPHFVMISPHEMSFTAMEPRKHTFSDDEKNPNRFLHTKIELLRDWEMLARTIEAAGGKVLRIDGHEGIGDEKEVFSRDAGILDEKTGTYFTPQRLSEETIRKITSPTKVAFELNKAELEWQNREQVANAMRAFGHKVVYLDNMRTEGGDVLIDNKHNILFVGVRGPESSSENLLEAMNQRRKPQDQLSLVKVSLEGWKEKVHVPEFYHLDTFMMTLPHGEAVIKYNNGGRTTNKSSYDRIVQAIGAENVITLKSSDIKNSTLNFIAVGDTLIMNEAPGDLRQQLEGRGYKLSLSSDIPTKDREVCWLFDNGSIHCVAQEAGRFPAGHMAMVKENFKTLGGVEIENLAPVPEQKPQREEEKKDKKQASLDNLGVDIGKLSDAVTMADGNNNAVLPQPKKGNSKLGGRE